MHYYLCLINANKANLQRLVSNKDPHIPIIKVHICHPFSFHLVNTSNYLDQMAMKFLTRKAVIFLTPLVLLLRSHLETQNTSYLMYLWNIDGA